MKQLKYTILLLLFFQFSSLHASEPISLKSNAQYQNAVKLYKNKQYKEALSTLDNLVKEYPTNENINYYYASSAFNLKNYELAFIYYDKILINNPMNHRVRLEYARTLFMLKSYDNAKEEFEKVLSSPIPAQVRKNVEKFLKLIESKQKSYIMNNIAIFGLGWDNNIDNATYEYNNNLIDGLVNSNTEKKKDYSFKNILVNNIVVPFKTNNKLAFENTVVSYYQGQKKYHQNDIYLLSLSSGLTYMNQNFKNTTSFLYDNIWVGSDRSIYVYGLGNSFKYKLDKNQIITLNVKYKKKKNVKDEDKGKDSNTKDLSLEYALLIDKTSKLTFNTGIESVRKENSTRTDVSKDDYHLKLSYQQDFLESYNYNISYQYAESKYKITSGDLPRREDDEHTLKLKVTKKIDKTQAASLELSRIDNRSNNNIYSYKKNKINLNYMIQF